MLPNSSSTAAFGTREFVASDHPMILSPISAVVRKKLEGMAPATLTTVRLVDFALAK